MKSRAFFLGVAGILAGIAVAGAALVAEETEQPVPAQQPGYTDVLTADPQVLAQAPELVRSHAGFVNGMSCHQCHTRIAARAADEAGSAVNFLTLAHGNALGVEVAALGEALRAQLNLEVTAGVVVTSIAADSEAAKAGLQQHDVVLKLGDKPISGPEEFHEAVAAEQGKEAPFQILRQGQPATLSIVLPKPPVYELAASTFLFGDNQYRIGVTLAEADDTLRSQLGLAAGESLVVTEVVADSPAAKAGIQRHDVLVKLDGKRLTTVEDINAQIQEIQERQVTAVFIRGGEEMSCDIAPQRGSAAPVHHLEHFHRWLQPMQSQNQADLYRWTVNLNTSGVSTQTAPLPASSAAEQIAVLKSQLAQMQKTLSDLEASLPAPSPEQQQPQPDKQEPPAE